MDEEIETLEGLVWDRPAYVLDGVPFIPHIHEGVTSEIPKGCNAVTIKIDGRARGDLSWKKERQQAQAFVAAGYFLFWDIDLGLFRDLSMALDHQPQFLSLALSLEHFRDTLWNEFKEKSLGLSIYRGSLDFSLPFTWDVQQIDNLRGWLKESFQGESHETSPPELQKSVWGKQLLRLFCRDTALEYLSLLAMRLPDSLPCYLFLDATQISEPLNQAQLLNPESYEHLNLALKGSLFSWQAMVWEEDRIYQKKDVLANIGIYFPSREMMRSECFEGMENALQIMLDRSIPFRIIAEEQLITCWSGLDYLLYSPKGLGPQGKRKLQGFCAAGGTVVTLGVPLGLPLEMSFEEFLATRGKRH